MCCCLLLAVNTGASALYVPTDEHTSNDKKRRGTGARMLVALWRVKPNGHGAPWCTQPTILKTKALCRVQGVHTYGTYCRVLLFLYHGSFLVTPLAVLLSLYGLDSPTSSTVTGMRGAARGRQPPTVKSSGTPNPYIYHTWYIHMCRFSFAGRYAFHYLGCTCTHVYMLQ